MHLRWQAIRDQAPPAEAVEIIRGRRRPDGRWAHDKVHEGEVHFEMDEGVGKPGRWISLRALRVVRWAT